MYSCPTINIALSCALYFAVTNYVQNKTCAVHFRIENGVVNTMVKPRAGQTRICGQIRGIFETSTSQSIHNGSGSHQYSIQQTVWTLSPAVNRPESEANHESTSIAEVDNAWNYNSQFRVELHGRKMVPLTVCFRLALLSRRIQAELPAVVF
jgi:hypothetical protein